MSSIKINNFFFIRCCSEKVKKFLGIEDYGGFRIGEYFIYLNNNYNIFNSKGQIKDYTNEDEKIPEIIYLYYSIYFLTFLKQEKSKVLEIQKKEKTSFIQKTEPTSFIQNESEIHKKEIFFVKN